MLNVYAAVQAMDHVPKGLNYHHSSGRRSAPSHASAAGTAVAGGVHCQEGECTKAPSYGWPGVPGGKPDMPVMCAMVGAYVCSERGAVFLSLYSREVYSSISPCTW